MIQRDTDGFTLHYTGADGKPATETPANIMHYGSLMDVVDKQNEAERVNIKAHGAYLTALSGYAQAPEKSTIPPKPTMLVVNDQGVESRVPFIPALPDPVPYNPVGGGSVASAPAFDRTDAILSIVMAQSKLVGKIAAKLEVQ